MTRVALSRLQKRSPPIIACVQNGKQTVFRKSTGRSYLRPLRSLRRREEESGGPSLLAPVDDDGGPWSKIDLSGTLAEASRRTLIEVERRKVEQALKEAVGNRGRAAELLQVSYKTFTAKLREYGFE